jgi:hypothetical protein
MMKKNCNILITFLIMLLMFSGNKLMIAQQASVSLDRDVIFVGEQTKLSLRFTIPSGASSYSFPLFEQDTISKQIEIISGGKIDTLSSDASFTELEQAYTITSFDSGAHLIPPLSFLWFSGSSTDPDIIFSDSLLLSVNLVEVDTTQAIMDIKNPWGIPFQWRDYLPHLLGGLLILILIIAGIYFYMRRRRGLPFFPERKVELLPPDEEALKALEKIKKEKIWRAGLIKDYYTVLTDTLRRYIERRYDIPAPEFTSSETMTALMSTDIDPDAGKKLQHILETADMVKFAKGNPAPTENENCLELAYVVVHATKPMLSENEEDSEHVKPTEKTAEV